MKKFRSTNKATKKIAKKIIKKPTENIAKQMILYDADTNSSEVPQLNIHTGINIFIAKRAIFVTINIV